MTACQHCNERPAVACDECRRALALLDHASGFGGIARHPELGETDCRLCERGSATLCVECLCSTVLRDRKDPRFDAYKAPTLEAFAADQHRAAADRERVAQVNREAGQEIALSFWDDSPSDRGPSWCRHAGW
jgi:hypothetical protein